MLPAKELSVALVTFVRGPDLTAYEHSLKLSRFFLSHSGARTVPVATARTNFLKSFIVHCILRAECHLSHPGASDSPLHFGEGPGVR